MFDVGTDRGALAKMMRTRLVLTVAFALLLSFGCSSGETPDDVETRDVAETPDDVEPTPTAARDRELPDYTPKIQILREQILEVLDAMDTFAAPKVLIWGVGYDSKLWCNENENGTTIFIEDVAEWAELAREQMDCRVVMVEYDTFVRDANALIDQPERLTLELPEDIQAMRFDVIVVDAPQGFSDDKPGRMKPIYMSSLLSHEGSHVFVDDFNRKIERSYSTRYLAPKFGHPVVIGGRGGLAHYFLRSFGRASGETRGAAGPGPGAARELPDYAAKIEILREQIVEVLDAVDSFDAPKVLIWGVGDDSKLWCNENANGTTIFVEDDPKWVELAREQTDCRVVAVDYGTSVRDYKELIDQPERLALELPEDIRAMRFDVIVVTAPHGFRVGGAGRMKPIYMSSLLSHEKSHVFVDNFNRKVQSTYSTKYLAPKFGHPVVIGGRGGLADYSRRKGR